MRLVVFDMDGTLIDTHELITQHMGAAFLNFGLKAPTPAAARSVIGLSLPVAVERLAPGAEPSLVDKLVAHYREGYRAAINASNGGELLYPGAEAALDRLRADAETVLGIATGKGLRGATRIMALHGLTEYFSTIQTPDHNPSKPHPGMVLRAMAETGAMANQTVMIGDTTFDIEMAVAANVASIGVSWGYHDPQELIAAGATAIIESYDALDDALARVLE